MYWSGEKGLEWVVKNGDRMRRGRKGVRGEEQVEEKFDHLNVHLRMTVERRHEVEMSRRDSLEFGEKSYYRIQLCSLAI